VSRSLTAIDRGGRTVAVLLGLAAVAVATTAYAIQRGSDDRREALTRPVPPALTTTTSAPVTTLVVGPAPSPRQRPTRPAAPHPVVAPIRPRHLFIPSIGVNTSVTAKPTELDHDPFLGRRVKSFGVPDNMYTTTWWSSGPRPGGRGMAIVLGHTQIGGYGVFNKLGTMRPGDVIGLTHADRVLRFSVIAVKRGISKRKANGLRNVLAAHPPRARLALLTCSGRFNGNFRESAENTVVFARLDSVT
jgi:hypothetical protein